MAAFQLNQQKLVQMLGNIQAMFLVGWRLCKLYESGKMTPGQASLGKVRSYSADFKSGYGFIICSESLINKSFFSSHGIP